MIMKTDVTFYQKSFLFFFFSFLVPEGRKRLNKKQYEGSGEQWSILEATNIFYFSCVFFLRPLCLMQYFSHQEKEREEWCLHPTNSLSRAGQDYFSGISLKCLFLETTDFNRKGPFRVDAFNIHVWVCVRMCIHVCMDTCRFSSHTAQLFLIM